MRAAHRIADPEAGRDVINMVYALGCQHALGDTAAKSVLDAIRRECARNRAAEYGLVEQFHLGVSHERARGPTIEGA